MIQEMLFYLMGVGFYILLGVATLVRYGYLGAFIFRNTAVTQVNTEDAPIVFLLMNVAIIGILAYRRFRR